VTNHRYWYLALDATFIFIAVCAFVAAAQAAADGHGTTAALGVGIFAAATILSARNTQKYWRASRRKRGR